MRIGRKRTRQEFMQEVPTVDITTTDTSGSVVAASDAITSDIRAEFDIEVVQRDLNESADLLKNVYRGFYMNKSKNRFWFDDDRSSRSLC